MKSTRTNRSSRCQKTQASKGEFCCAHSERKSYSRRRSCPCQARSTRRAKSRHQTRRSTTCRSSSPIRPTCQHTIHVPARKYGRIAEEELRISSLVLVPEGQLQEQASISKVCVSVCVCVKASRKTIMRCSHVQMYAHVSFHTHIDGHDGMRTNDTHRLCVCPDCVCVKHQQK